MYTVLNCIRPFEGDCGADVAPGENEFDTPALCHSPPRRLCSRHTALMKFLLLQDYFNGSSQDELPQCSE